MKKITVVGVLLLCIVSIVVAWNVDDIITQEELDGMTIELSDMNPMFLNNSNNDILVNCTEGINICYAYVQYTTLNNNGDGTYTGVNETVEVEFDKEHFSIMFDERGQEYTYNQFRTYLLFRARSIVNAEHEVIDSFKTINDEDNINSIVSGQGRPSII